MLIAAATRANVADLRRRSARAGRDGARGHRGRSRSRTTTLGIGSTSFQNELRLSQDSLRVLSSETGGFAIVNTNDFGTAFQRIVDDNSSYYVLGYYPTNERRDGRFRKIEVRVPGHPDVHASAPARATSPRAAACRRPSRPARMIATPELRNAMSSPLPLSELPMAATAAVFKGPQPNGSVVVSALIGGGTLPLVEKDGNFHNNLEMARGGGEPEREDVLGRAQHARPEHEAGHRQARRRALASA